MDRNAAVRAVARLRADVDALLAADLTALGSVEIMSVLRELETERRRLDAVDVGLVSEVEQRGLAGDYGRASTVDLLVTSLRVTPAEAKSRVLRAGDVGPRRARTGEALEPLQPLVAASLREGVVSAAHATVISRCLDRLPAHLPDNAFEVAERFLVDAATHLHPRAVAASAAMLLARLDPDGTAPGDREVERTREFTVRKNADGSARGSMVLTAEATATWETILDALAAPAPSTEGMRDDRSPAQRRHDAFLDAGRRLLSSASLPPAGGAPLTVLVTARLADLQLRRGVAQTGHGDVWPIRRLLAEGCRPTADVVDENAAADDARGWPGCDSDETMSRRQVGAVDVDLCAAEMVPVVVDEQGAPLWLGRTRRLATRAQRLALIARDGGCTFPGCDRPAAWSEVHHVREWSDGGPTDIDNMCMLCRFHHREFERRGWQVRMSAGLPEWIPPRFIDVAQRPMRNHAHHPPDFEFASTRLAS